MHSAGDTAAAREIVTAAARRYIAERRRRVPGFVAETFSLRASLRLHSHAFGWDLLRAPVNVLLIVPTVIAMLLGALCSRLGWKGLASRLRGGSWFLHTDVGREVEWLIHTRLLELPVSQPGRASRRDALAEAIVEQARIAGCLHDVAGGNAPERERLRLALAAYTGARAAAAEITNVVVMLGAGAATLHQLTPGALSLGPALALAAAQQAAIASFPLGTTLGGLWYGVFPPEPPLSLVIGATLGLLLVLASVAAFSGVLADPVQSRFGLHERRLQRLLDTLEHNLCGDEGAHFAPRDHYVTRLVDLLEIARAVLR